MAKSESSKSVRDRLKKAGFKPARKCNGSHVVYECSGVKISVPIGHGTISPGVQRKVDRAIDRV